MENKFTPLISGFKKNVSDIGMVVFVIGILIVMLLPIHPVFLDLLLALNIAIAIIILITTMYTNKAVDFTIFPSILLVFTLFRLALNVASTRLILLHGQEGIKAAGSIIMAFGSFVVGGNYVVGAVIFIILVLINFIVITKGSGRIAEVAARFTLDGMPGKQMAIDADLNAGMIDETEAKQRREAISKESEFHGAMDGASKFVRGDAIAGIIITVINIVGGIIIGVFQMDMTMADASQNYTLLTIGDGLVSQIPALIISTASGLLVSRSGSEDKMGKEFGKHISKNPVPVYLGSIVIFIFGMVPGLPAFPFLTLAVVLSSLVYFFQKQDRAELKGEIEKADDEEFREEEPDEVEHLLAVDLLELEVGYGLIPLVDKAQDGSLLGRIKALRKQFALELGVVIPPIHIRDNLKLKPSEYRVLIKGVELVKGELMIDHMLAMDPGGLTEKIEGIPTKEPAFNLPALWIPADKEEDAKFAGYTVVDNPTVIATHLTELIRSSVADLLGRQDVQHLLDNLSKSSPKVVEELIPGQLPLGIVQKVLQNLLRERVSIRDLLTIVEVLADYAPMSKDPELLTEYVRQKLSVSIISSYIQDNGILDVITVDPKIEEVLSRGIRQTEQGTYMGVEPSTMESIVFAIKAEIEKVTLLSIQPVLLCSPVLRRHLRTIVESFMPTAAVFSHAEIVRDIRVKAVGKVVI